MRYRLLFELAIKHPYYVDSRCPDFRIEPHPAGDRLMRKHRLVMKTWEDGAGVLVPVDDADMPFIPFAPDTTLRFGLRAANPELALFTDMSELIATRARTFTNRAGEDVAQEGALALASSLDATTNENGIFAEIGIAGVETFLPSSVPVAFHIAFAPRRQRWTYYLVTDLQPKKNEELRIVDEDPSSARARLSFDATGARDLVSQPDASDALGTALVAGYPGMRIVRFVSDEPIACSEEPRRHLALHLDKQRLLDALPNPSIRDYARVETGTTSQQHETLFCVIEHRSRTLR